jgi:hypothetical protein
MRGCAIIVLACFVAFGSSKSSEVAPQIIVYVTGCTVDDRLPVTPGAFEAQRKGNADAFLLRMRIAASQQAVQSDRGKKNEG